MGARNAKTDKPKRIRSTPEATALAARCQTFVFRRRCQCLCSGCGARVRESLRCVPGSVKHSIFLHGRLSSRDLCADGSCRMGCAAQCAVVPEQPQTGPINVRDISLCDALLRFWSVSRS